MKKLYLFTYIFLLLLNSSVFASNNSIILQIKTYGGLTTEENQGYQSGIKIFKNGLIESYSQKNSIAPLKKITLAQLSITGIESLIVKAQSLKNRELISATPDDPVCSDSGSTDFIYFPKSEGTTIEGLVFARNAQCHQFFTTDSWARPIKIFLDNLRILGTPQ
jgi:hypothetical protein